MLRRSILTVLCVSLLGLVCPAWAASDPSLVGWWWFDEGAGTVAADSSGHVNNGTLMNGPTWVPGVFGTALQFDGVDDFVQVPHNASLCVTSEVSVMAWVNAARYQYGTSGYQGIISKSNSPRSYSLYTTSSGTMHFSTNGVGTTSSGVVPLNEWAHLCVIVRNGGHQYYINGVGAGSGGSGITLPGTNDTAPVLIGDSAEASREFQGMMDDVRIYNRALTLGEIGNIMAGNDLVTNRASFPAPSNDAKDVPQDAVLEWVSGVYAAAHDVYLGTSLEDVENASRDNPMGVLVSQGQPGLGYDVESLFEFGQTYYWRVDEVNAAPDGTIFKGNVWSFTAETYGYAITGVTATASSSNSASTPPQNTVNGSGLNDADQHSIKVSDMWLSGKVGPHWIQYEFDAVHSVAQLLVWNANQDVEPFVGFGAKDVAIEYSIDGENWTALENVPQFARATGKATYTANTTVDFGGILAKYVRLAINSTWGGVPQVSLSEVRFTTAPVAAYEPTPADGAANVSLDTVLNWRPGRGTTSHQVFFGTDSNAVAEGLATTEIVTDHRYTPAPMTFGATYFWKVDEIGDAGTYAGDVWSFTSKEFVTVEDFESYNDSDNRVFDVWVDGYGDDTNGSLVGYIDSDNGTFGETTIVHGGQQSMPLNYDNSGASYSETVREFDASQNWTGSGATDVCVWTRGYPALTATTVTETGGKMSLTGAGADIWGNSDELTYAYKTLAGDGTMIARVTSTGTGSSSWAKGGVMIRQSADGGSKQAMMAITTPGANGASFQYRVNTNGGSATADSAAVVSVPAWVKIERTGNTLTGYTSTDAKTWTIVGTTVIEMADPVLIGICITSHMATEERTYQFEGIASTGNVTGAWKGAVIDAPLYNDAADMYLTVTDSAGKSATVTSATAALTSDWTRWVIPMSDLTGVSFSKVKKITIGVGSRSGAPTGASGIVFIDDIGYGHAAE